MGGLSGSETLGIEHVEFTIVLLDSTHLNWPRSHTG